MTPGETDLFRQPAGVNTRTAAVALLPVIAAGTAHLLVQRAIRWPGLWSFDGPTRERAFADLVAYIERGVVPDGDDVLGDVPKLGLRWTPTLHAADPARR